MSDLAMRRPRPGDIWHLTHDGAYLGTGLVVAVFDRQWCLVWPLTERDAAHGETNILLEGVDSRYAVAWPNIETGVDLRLLTQYVSSPFDEVSVRALALGVQGDDTEFPAGAARATGDAVQGERLNALVGRWARVCFLEPSSC